MDNKPALDQIIADLPSHNLNNSYNSLSPYDVTRPKWVTCVTWKLYNAVFNVIVGMIPCFWFSFDNAWGCFDASESVVYWGRIIPPNIQLIYKHTLLLNCTLLTHNVNMACSSNIWLNPTQTNNSVRNTRLYPWRPVLRWLNDQRAPTTYAWLEISRPDHACILDYFSFFTKSHYQKTVNDLLETGCDKTILLHNECILVIVLEIRRFLSMM